MSRGGSDFEPVYRWCNMYPNEFDGIYSISDFEDKMNELGFPYQNFPNNVQNKLKDIVGFTERPPIAPQPPITDTDRRQVIDSSVDDLRESLIDRGIVEDKPLIVRAFERIKDFLGRLF